MKDSHKIARAKKGVRVMLTECLGMCPNEDLLLVTDENHCEELVLICEVARRLKINVCSMVIPTATQYAIKRSSSLPGLLRESILHCHAMLVLVEYSAASTPFRMAVLQYFTDKKVRGKAGSMPGVTLDEFHYADVNYIEMVKHCEDLANLLLRTNTVTIETVDKKGNTHELRIKVRGKFPDMGNGRINDGDWDNIPSGETFILPVRGNSEGSIAINGSLPGLVLDKEEVILEIHKGRIRELKGSSPVVEKYARDLFFKPGPNKRLKTRNSTTLCELGFGVNKSITKLHGQPIFDEKIWGSIHLAFGRNDQLGGEIKGKAHHDLVVIRPNVSFYCNDGFYSSVIKNGQISISDDMVQLDWTKVHPKCKAEWRIEKIGPICSIDPQTNELVMEWFQCMGPRATTRIGNHETSILAAQAYKILKRNMSIGELVEKLRKQDITEEAAWASLVVLRSYGIIKVKKK